MANEIQAPKGTKDMLPQDAYKWHYIESVFRNVTKTYGIREIRTPIFEHTELFQRSVGDTTDIVQKEIAAIERDKIKTDYIILMSHEFRTPINIILNSAKLLKMKCDNDDYDKDYYKTRLNYIIKNCNRLSKTVNNSIDVAKLESGIMSTNFRMYNIIRVVEDITETIIDFAAVNNIKVATIGCILK